MTNESVQFDRRIIAIAPYGMGIERIPEDVRKKPFLVFWAEQDPVHKIADLQFIAESFDKVGK